MSSVAAGAEVDELVLTELARRGNGSYFPFTPGRSIRSLALAILSAQYGAALEDAKLTLPAGFSDPHPRDLPAIRAGDELLVVARMEPRVRGEVVLQGRVGGEEYEQRYAIDIETTTAKGNAFVPRLWAEAKIANLTLRDAAANKDQIVQLSRDHHVLSRFTSLLVLESEAMFKAFDIDRPPPVAGDWTGEDAIETQEFHGTVDHSDKGMARSLSAAPRAEARDLLSLIADGWGGGGWSEPMPPFEPAAPPRPGQGPGMWMRRTWQRRAEIRGPVTVRSWDRRQIEELRAKYNGQPDSRDRTKALYLALSRAGGVDEALELAEKWWAKDRLDPEALERMALAEHSRGNGKRALRLLGSMADLAPRNAALHERLALAYSTAGKTAEARAHRRALAALKPDDAAAAAAAYQCLAWLGKTDRAEALVERFGNEMTRARLRSQLQTSEPVVPDIRGELRIEAMWDHSENLDLVLVHPDGRRSTWMGGVAGTTAKYASDDRREDLGFRRLRVGLYRIEIVRHERRDTREAGGAEDQADDTDDEADDTDAEAARTTDDDVRVADSPVRDDADSSRAGRAASRPRTIRGEVRVTALGRSRRLSFTLADDEVRVGVGSVEVTRHEVLVPVGDARLVP